MVYLVCHVRCSIPGSIRSNDRRCFTSKPRKDVAHQRYIVKYDKDYDIKKYI